ncbi:uncharacterized protein BCR38DRAFT_342915 [Pseudomassariella vexata]|uniref:F-box domain-containing protein n=1 Tax=Pseudomassariella vexata TaxID=1141098 RepID=A0A1Y2DZ24_9PEZI|nr:uncharacterized protein BCR38DRAFT_342915 [Pseudomassariella vexata]ORY64513.1 hypothetical protein BCR38DRAFT_342915 [Pseudomassariella vexata]
MDPYPPSQEPDEGYSEHPLYPSIDSNAAALASNLRSPAEFAAWMCPRLSTLSVTQKTQLAMAILDDLPTTVIAEIVAKKLNPRLYINFVEYLPPEICLKIFGYLDPLSLIHVAKSSREWFNLALDRQLWEKLFYLEGWRAIPTEITAAEERMNAGLVTPEAMHSQRLRSSEYGHAHKKRAISDADADSDSMDIDREEDVEMSGTSLFGGPPAGSGSSSKSTGSVIRHLGHLMMESPSPMPESRTQVDVKGKGKAIANSYDNPAPSSILLSVPKSTLWAYASKDRRYKINWQYLYSMRRRLEDNWDAGRYTNFQLPHPNHPGEGHKECIYSIQYNAEFLVSGSRDKTLRIWNMRTRRLIRPPLRGHVGSVLCLQFDSDPKEDLIVSGSSDSDVILWKFSTGQPIQRLNHAHRESVLNVKFDKRILVTCSKDKTIKIFNRTQLRPGEPGYGDINAVSPVPINLKNYDYDDSPLNQLPIKPAYSQIGCLEGHGAAVNAVQICGDEIVSASGDRHIKVWDWPNQVCRRTFLGHNKGIACVQYDGRRIVSGSSDNEVKIFDRETGLEVASLRTHSNLVRTVQAGFGDLPYSVEEDRLAAREIDQEYFAARDAGTLGDTLTLARGKAVGNAGSRRPEDITAYGAKLPPGGGGGPYGRIVSGSYDQSIIIWRRDKQGVWKPSHSLRQEDGAVAAQRERTTTSSTGAIPRSSSPLPVDGCNSAQPAHRHNARPINVTHAEQSNHATVIPPTPTSYTQMVDACVLQGPAALRHALASFPTMLTYHSHIQAVIDREPNARTRSQMRHVVTTALVRAQTAQEQTSPGQSSSAAGLSTDVSMSRPSNAGPPADIATRRPTTAGPPSDISSHRPAVVGPSADVSTRRPAASRHVSQVATAQAPTVASTSSASSAAPGVGLPAVTNGIAQAAQMVQQGPNNTQAQATAQPQAAATTTAAAPAPAQHHPHIAQADANPARVFKLQFDARRIICCSQTTTIVGWDFCNGDAELEEASRFFGAVE